eukprot:427418_1
MGKTKWSQDRDAVEKELLSNDKLNRNNFFFCRVTNKHIVDIAAHIFAFRLHIPSRDIYADFNMNFNQVKSGHDAALKHLPVVPFPSRQNEEQHIKLMNMYSVLDDGLLHPESNPPYACELNKRVYKNFFCKRRANRRDAQTLAHVLTKLFNSPFMMQDPTFITILEECEFQCFNDTDDTKNDTNIDNELTTLSNIKMGFLRSPTVLVGNNANVDRGTFNQITAISLSFQESQSSDLFEHWALILDGGHGGQYILKLEYGIESTEKKTFEMNNYFGQTRTWYMESETKFDRRHGTLFKCHLDEQMSFEVIDRLVTVWKQEHPLYDITTNNCQHFVVDMLSLFNQAGAYYLVEKMQIVEANKVCAPTTAVCNLATAEKRINTTRNILQNEWNAWQAEQE